MATINKRAFEQAAENKVNEWFINALTTFPETAVDVQMLKAVKKLLRFLIDFCVENAENFIVED